MNEHYAAARHHQTMRLQSMALIVTASATIFVAGVKWAPFPLVPAFFGITLVVLGCLCMLLNATFNRSNRYHVEIAKRAREQITKVLEGGSSPAANDPNLIGRAIRNLGGGETDDNKFEEELRAVAADPNRKGPKFAVEASLHVALRWIPWLIILAGLLLAGYLGNWLCFLCRSSS
jgi:hypothetical protein